MTNEKENVKQEIENILKSVAQLQNIKNYEIFSDPNVILGDGFMSEFFTGEVSNKDNGNTIQVAIKKAPTDGFKTDSRTEDIYRNETYFYSKLFPNFDKFQKDAKVKYPFDNIPRYFAGNVDSKNMFVAMENLTTAGYRLHDKKQYLDSKHIELIFKTYGKFHALSFSFKEKHAQNYQSLVEKLTNLLLRFTNNSEITGIMKKVFSTAIETFDPVTEAAILTKLKNVQDIVGIARNALTYKGCYTCNIHGDCWSNNMLFKYKQSGELEDVKLVDFQVSCCSTPIHDLSYFFYSGASKKDMDKLDDYLELYYQSFSDFARELGGNPEEMFPFEILKKEWKEYGIWGIIFGCQLWLIKLMDRDEIANVLNQKGLPASEYWKIWNEKIDQILAGQEHREKVKHIWLHAVEYGFL